MLIPVALLAVTGSYFTWPRQYRAAIAVVSPLTPSEPPKSDVARRGPARPPLEALVAQARAQQPDARLNRLFRPGAVTDSA